MTRRMKRVGVMGVVISAAFAGIALADSSRSALVLVSDSTMHGSGAAATGSPTQPDKHTDLTGGKSGVPSEYSDTPVRQGKLQEVADSKWLNKSVRGMQGDIVGKIDKVLKDQTTGEIEYVVLVPSDSKTPVPLRWSHFREENNELKIDMKKEELKTALNPTTSKDMSPDLQQYMDQLDRVRAEPKAGTSKGSATSSPSDVGPSGESQTAPGGASGPQTLPEGQAPGLEGNNPSSKR